MRETAPVDVVIVSWNSAAWLPGCLDSLARLERPARRVIVVDAASDDASADLARAHPVGAEVIACEENVGFCRGNNIGFRAGDSRFVLALNPDTRVEGDFVERLLEGAVEPDAGIVCGKLLRFDGRTIDSAGQLLGRSRRPLDRGYGRPDGGTWDRDEEVFGACGAAALYRRAMLDAVADPGGEVFDEAFFAFGEDLDLAWRARRLGWRALYRHRAVAYHARGGSSAREPGPAPGRALFGRSREVLYHVWKNRYLTILRNDRLGSYLLHLPWIWGRDLAVTGLITLRAPGLWRRLWRDRGLFRRALGRRRLDGLRTRHNLCPGAQDTMDDRG